MKKIRLFLSLIVTSVFFVSYGMVDEAEKIDYFEKLPALRELGTKIYELDKKIKDREQYLTESLYRLFGFKAGENNEISAGPVGIKICFVRIQARSNRPSRVRLK